MQESELELFRKIPTFTKVQNLGNGNVIDTNSETTDKSNKIKYRVMNF